MNIEQAAKICHEANRAYCETIGDSTHVSWDLAPDWQKQSARNGVQSHLAVLQEGGKPDPASSHKNWMHEKAVAGWKYGPVKDPDKKEHPCFVAYEDLPLEQKAKDFIFCGIVEALYRVSPKTASAS